MQDRVIIKGFSLQAAVRVAWCVGMGGVGPGYILHVSVEGQYGTEGGIEGRKCVFNGGRVAPGVHPWGWSIPVVQIAPSTDVMFLSFQVAHTVMPIATTSGRRQAGFKLSIATFYFALAPVVVLIPEVALILLTLTIVWPEEGLRCSSTIA